MRGAPAATGVRLLPPRDPYTQLFDRQTIVPRALHAEIWRTVGEPGTLLVDGEIVGWWRAKKSGSRLALTARLFDRITEGRRRRLAAEADLMGALRGASTVELMVE